MSSVAIKQVLETSKQVNFSTLLRKITMFPAQRATLGQLEQQLQQARADATAFASEKSAPIDFKTYATRLENAPFLKAVEEAYAKISFPEPTIKPATAEEEAADLKWAQEVQELSLKSALAGLEMRWEIQFLENNRFDENTTFNDVEQRYPEIYARVEEDMQRGRYFKDIVPGF